MAFDLTTIAFIVALVAVTYVWLPQDETDKPDQNHDELRRLALEEELRLKLNCPESAIPRVNRRWGTGCQYLFHDIESDELMIDPNGTLNAALVVIDIEDKGFVTFIKFYVTQYHITVSGLLGSDFSLFVREGIIVEVLETRSRLGDDFELPDIECNFTLLEDITPALPPFGDVYHGAKQTLNLTASLHNTTNANGSECYMRLHNEQHNLAAKYVAMNSSVAMTNYVTAIDKDPKHAARTVYAFRTRIPAAETTTSDAVEYDLFRAIFEPQTQYQHGSSKSEGPFVVITNVVIGFGNVPRPV